MSRVQTFAEWLFTTVDWRISSGGMKGKRYEFGAFPCQYDMVNDESHQQAIIKSAQMAVSEHYSLARPFYYLDVHQVNWAVMFPTQGAMHDFFRTRIKSAIDENPYIKRMTRAINASNVSAFGRELYLRYTTTEESIATFDADGITVDEMDLHNPGTLYGAKTSRSQGSMRDTYWFDVSTPSFPKVGIHQAFLNSDQMIWLIKCSGCGYENDLTRRVGEFDINQIENFFREYLPDDKGAAWKDYHIPCSSCGKAIDTVSPIDPAKLSAGGGRWVARYPDRGVRGYHLQIFQRVYDRGFAQVLQRVRRSLLSATKQEHVRRWYNLTLGIPFVPSEGRLSDEDLESITTKDYNDKWGRDVANATVFRIAGMSCDFMGVDVRDKQYHIIGLKRMGDRRLLAAVGWVETSGQVRDLWERLGCPNFGIDSQPDTNESRVLVKAMGRRAFRGKFGKGMNSVFQETAEESLYAVNRPRIMEEVKAMVESFMWIVPEPAWTVGAGIKQSRGTEEYEETLADHFKAPVQIKVYNETLANDEYDFPKDAMEGIDPHFYMAACLAHVASQAKAAPASVIIIPR